MHFSMAQANLPKMYLEYFPISFHVDFFSPHVAFALEAFVHLYAAAKKNVLFSAQSNKKSVNLGTLPVFDFCHQTPCEKHTYLFVWKHERIYTEKTMEKWRNCMEMWSIFKEKWKIYRKKYEFDWKSKRIYMAKIWKSEEIVWKCEGFLKKYENKYGTNRTLTEIVKEFI